jgi:hypothetical protein
MRAMFEPAQAQQHGRRRCSIMGQGEKVGPFSNGLERTYFAGLEINGAPVHRNVTERTIGRS